MIEVETCMECDNETGRAGIAEDSIYCGECGNGPYCENCWGQLDRELCGSCEAKLLAAEHRLRAIVVPLIEEALAKAAKAAKGE
jgi:hypothetical protein